MNEEELRKQMDDGSFYDKDYFNDEIKSNYGSYEDYPAFRDWANKIFQLWLPKRIIDVGCARGFMVKWWRRLGAEAYGIDISKWAIDNAPDEIKEYVFQGDIRDIKFPNNFFDLVFCSETLEHLFEEDLNKAIGELFRICRNFCVMSTPGSANPDEKDTTHVSIHPDQFWIDKFGKAGFEFLGKKEDFDLVNVKNSEAKGDWTTNNIFVFKRYV